MSEWISVDERSPEVEDGMVLAWDADKEGDYHFALRESSGSWVIFIGGWSYTESITHWMPLPEPPKN